MVAFNWSHEPGTSTSPLASTMPHSHPAVPTHSDYPSSDVAAMLAWCGWAEGAGSVGRAEVETLVSGPSLLRPAVMRAGRHTPITHPYPGRGRGGHCVLQ